MAVTNIPKGILKRGDSYRVQASVKGVRKTGTTETLEDAIILKATLTKELQNSKAQKGSQFTQTTTSWTLADAISKTNTLIWAGKGGEISAMKNARALEKFFGADTLLTDITLETVDSFVEHCIEEKGNSGATVNRKLACLSRILRTAYDRGKLPAMFRMPRRSEGENRVRFLSHKEEAKLIDMMDKLVTQNVQDAILILLYTGLRCGELWRLECRDIDLEQATVTAWKTKNNNPRTIPIVDTLKPVIERLIRQAGGTGKLLPKGSNEWLRRPWAILRHHMGMDRDEQFVPHMLRHTCATRLSQAGVSMPIIKEWLGHTTITTTARYAHFSPKDLRNAAKLLKKT